MLTLVLNVNNNINNNNNNNNNLNINAVDSSNVVANFNTNNANQVKDSFSLSSFSSFPLPAPLQLLKKTQVNLMPTITSEHYATGQDISLLPFPPSIIKNRWFQYSQVNIMPPGKRRKRSVGQTASVALLALLKVTPWEIDFLLTYILDDWQRIRIDDRWLIDDWTQDDRLAKMMGEFHVNMVFRSYCFQVAMNLATVSSQACQVRH